MAKTTYDPSAIEEKWQAFWEQQNLFQGTETQDVTSSEDAMYLLFAFAYPSGSGLHVGHVESKTALDILARYYRMKGKKVFFPVGWDAFGLPAENYAIKTGTPPAETTKSAIKTFRRQLKRIGISYDWQNEIATCHPEYYKWTQWIFLQLYNQGLAYQSLGAVNWCPQDQTVLANEQVVNGECERCGATVIQKQLKQWYFKITDYKDELISGLDTVDWPEPTKQQQLNWIGRSEGIEITYQVADSTETITCFTTTPVNFGATFIVVAPEHTIVSKITTAEQKDAVEDYILQASKNSELERTINKEKTGVFTGSYAINQVTGERMPIYVADFALAHVGTGAVQGCPAHDERDFEFAKKFNLPINRVVVGDDGDTSPVTKKEQLVVKGMNGTMINSDFLDGLNFTDAMKETMDYFEEKGWGKRIVNYKLRDWLISRQRYWGAPIPIVYDPQGKAHPVKEEHLPWMLPTDVDFKPTGESPLKSSKEFKERVEKLYGKGWTPEYDTMDTFVDSSWYFMRYVDSRNSDAFADATQLQKWLPVDLYMIGPEHIVLHLLYARFFTKFLRDQGYLNFDEPFMKMRHQGMILGPDGKKMSKSKGNVINPDDVVSKFGADTLRMYEMFMGPLEADKPWNVTAVAGVYRFLNRVHELVTGVLGNLDTSTESSSRQVTQSPSKPILQRKLHQTIRKVTQDIPDLKFNTAISALMEFTNLWEISALGNLDSPKNFSSDPVTQSSNKLGKDEVISFVKLLAPFAPFIAEELYAQITGSTETIHTSSWPTWDEQKAQEDVIKIAVQINGKVRSEIVIPFDKKDDKEYVIGCALKDEHVIRWLDGKETKKQIYVPGKIVSLVV